MKQLKKAVSLIATLAFLITALIPVAGFAAAPVPIQTSIQLTLVSGTTAPTTATSVYVWADTDVPVSIVAGDSVTSTETREWGSATSTTINSFDKASGDDLHITEPTYIMARVDTDGNSSDYNYSQMLKVIPVKVAYEITGTSSNATNFTDGPDGSGEVDQGRNGQTITLTASPTKYIAVGAENDGSDQPLTDGVQGNFPAPIEATFAWEISAGTTGGVLPGTPGNVDHVEVAVPPNTGTCTYTATPTVSQPNTNNGWIDTTAAQYALEVKLGATVSVASVSASPQLVALGRPVNLTALVNGGDQNDSITWFSYPTDAPEDLAGGTEAVATQVPLPTPSPDASQVAATATAFPDAGEQWYDARVQENYQEADAAKKPSPVYGAASRMPRVQVVQLWPAQKGDSKAIITSPETYNLIEGMSTDLTAVWGAPEAADGDPAATASPDQSVSWSSPNTAVAVTPVSGTGINATAKAVNRATGAAADTAVGTIAAVDVEASYPGINGGGVDPVAAQFHIQPLVLAAKNSGVSGVTGTITDGFVNSTGLIATAYTEVVLPLLWWEGTTDTSPDTLEEGAVSVEWTVTAPEGVTAPSMAASTVQPDGTISDGKVTFTTPGDYTVKAVAKDTSGNQIGGLDGVSYSITVNSAAVGTLVVVPTESKLESDNELTLKVQRVVNPYDGTLGDLPENATGAWSIPASSGTTTAGTTFTPTKAQLGWSEGADQRELTIKPNASLVGTTVTIAYNGTSPSGGPANATIEIISPAAGSTVTLNPVTVTEGSTATVTGTLGDGSTTLPTGTWAVSEEAAAAGLSISNGVVTAPTGTATQDKTYANGVEFTYELDGTETTTYANITVKPASSTPAVDGQVNITLNPMSPVTVGTNVTATATPALQDGTAAAGTWAVVDSTGNPVAGITNSAPTATSTVLGTTGVTPGNYVVRYTYDGNPPTGRPQFESTPLVINATTVTPEGAIVGAPLLNADAQATVIGKTNMVGQPGGVVAGSAVSITLANPDFATGAASGNRAPATVTASGTVDANGLITLNVSNEDRDAILAALNDGGVVTYTITSSTPAMETLGIASGTTVDFMKPAATNIVWTQPELTSGEQLPLTGNSVLACANDVPNRTLEVVGANGQAIPGSWDFAGNAGDANTSSTLEGLAEELPVPTVLQLIQPGQDANGQTSNQVANLQVQIGVAPGVYTVTYNTSSARAAITLTIYVDAIWPATPTIDVGENVTLTAYRYTRQKAVAGNWTLPDNTVAITAPTTSLTNTNSITLVGQFPTTIPVGQISFANTNVTIPMKAEVTVKAAPRLQQISYVTQGQAQATSGQLAAPPANTSWTQLDNGTAQPNTVLGNQMRVAVNNRFALYMPEVDTNGNATTAASQAYVEWQYRTVDGGNPIIIPVGQGFYGVNSNTLVSGPITAAMDGWQFRLVGRPSATAAATTNVYSPWVQLTVPDAEKIKEQPTVTITSSPESNAGTVSIAETGTVILTAGVQSGLSGATLAYQWQSRPAATVAAPNPQWSDIPGETDKTYTISDVQAAQNGVSYRCVVSNNSFNGIAGKSNSLTLQVNTVAGAVIIESPTSPSLINRFASRTATFDVTAKTDNGDDVTYTWYRRGAAGPVAVGGVITTWQDAAAYLAERPTTETAIAGATEASYTTPELEEGVYEYVCRVTNAKTNTLTQNTPGFYVVVTRLSRKPAITEPGEYTGYATDYESIGAAAGETVSFECKATVQSQEDLTYQWQASQNAAGPWANLTGATSATFTMVPSGLNNGWFYRCVVTNAAAELETASKPYQLTVWNTATLPTVNAIQPANILGQTWVAPDPLVTPVSAQTTLTLTSTASVAIDRAFTGTRLSAVWYLNGERADADPDWNSAWVTGPTATATGTTATRQAYTTSISIPLLTEQQALKYGGNWECKWTNEQETVTTLLKPMATSGTCAVSYIIPDCPTITVQPKDVTQTVGATATIAVGAVLNAPATQNAPAGTLVYVWQRSKDGGTTWENCPAENGQFTSALTIPLTQEMYDNATAANDKGFKSMYTYRVNVANRTSGLNVYSDEAVLTIRPGTEVTPSIGVKDGVDLTITDNAELGKILSGTALTVTKNGHKASEVQEMLTFAPDNAAYAIRIVNAEGEALSADDIVGTGCKIQLIDTADNDKVLDDATVTIVVRGDVNGSGVISLTQLVRMAAGFKDASQLSPLYTLAGDMDGSGAINLTDLVQEAAIYRAEILDAAATPTPAPTAAPTTEPSAEPTVEPSAEPTVEPTAEPTSTTTAEPTATPTASATESPSAAA